jgi:neutral ceramidase
MFRLILLAQNALTLDCHVMVSYPIICALPILLRLILILHIIGETSSCNGKCQNCIAFGPGTNGDIFESTQIIGDKQFQHALTLMKTIDGSSKPLTGAVDYRHSYVQFPGLKVNITSLRKYSYGYSDSDTVTLCSPAMGYSFAAGTTDGPGMFNFTQGTTTGNPFWNKVRDFLSEPTKQEMACQHPKPILLNTADIDIPYEWDPLTISLQILRVGNFFILSVPSEFTTMAGRRLRELVSSIFDHNLCMYVTNNVMKNIR